MATKIPNIRSEELLNLVPANKRAKIADKLMKLNKAMKRAMKTQEALKKLG
jgi:hypothetical protein